MKDLYETSIVLPTPLLALASSVQRWATRWVIPAQETVDELTERIETLAYDS